MKVIFDKKTVQLLGAHMVGVEVTELIQGLQRTAAATQVVAQKGEPSLAWRPASLDHLLGDA